jgi:hypothetical protein
LEIRASIDIALPIERTFDVWVDAARYPQWQGGVLAVTDVTGSIDAVGTTYVLDHGPKLKRTVRVVDVERPVRHVIEQEGVGLQDHTVATFERIPNGTRLSIAVYLKMNRVLRALAHLDRQSRRDREARAELERFAAVATRQPGPARIGGIYDVRAGHAIRRLTVIGVDQGYVHVRLHPGHRNHDEPADRRLKVPGPVSEQLQLTPLQPPLRAGISVGNEGLPFLLRDGGHGVAHLALNLDAWADGQGRDSGLEDETIDDDLAAIDAWRVERAPAVGDDPGLSLAPVATLKLGVDEPGADTWGVVKVLRSEIMRVHLAVYGERWPTRPDSVLPWQHRLQRMDPADIEAGRAPDVRLGVGHVPLARGAFVASKPRFEGVTTLAPSELEGYQIWRDASGGTFDSLHWMLDWPPDVGT